MTYKRPDLAVKVNIQGAKGYTMKEIAKLESRIGQLEYYSALNALALDTKTTSITNDNGIERFKNGIFADPFNDSAMARTNDAEFNMAINSAKSIARPNFNDIFISFEIDSYTSTGVKSHGRMLMLDYDNIKLGGNPYATTYRNVAENFFNFKGAVHLYPNFDNTNTNTQAAPQTITTDVASAFQDQAATGAFRDISKIENTPQQVAKVGDTNYFQQTTTTTVKDIQVSTTTTTQDLGNVVTDVSEMPYMKGRRIALSGSHFKPNTRLYCYFDKQSVDKYVAPALLAPSLINNDKTINQAAFDAVAFTADPSAIYVQNDAVGSPIYSNSKGDVKAFFFLPDNVFRSGQRNFVMTNVDNLDATGAIITIGEGFYQSQGLQTTKKDVSFQVIKPIFTPSSITTTDVTSSWQTKDPPPPPPPQYNGGGGGGGGGDGGGGGSRGGDDAGGAHCGSPSGDDG